MLNVRLAGDHLYGKYLFPWLSLVISMMVAICTVLFPNEMWDLIESVYESFPTYPCCSVICVSPTTSQVYEMDQIPCECCDSS